MMKKALLPVFFGFLYVAESLAPASVFGREYGSPWIESDMTLPLLVKDGYCIVSTTSNLSTIGEFVVEFVYLQKGDKLYKCTTIEGKGEKKHRCECLVEAEKFKPSLSKREANAIAHYALKETYTYQEAYFADHQTYANEMKLLYDSFPDFRPVEGVEIIMKAIRNDFTIEAYHKIGDKRYLLKSSTGRIEEKNR